MRWPWTIPKELVKNTEKNKEEIKDVKERLDNIESIDIIAEKLAILQRNGE